MREFEFHQTQLVGRPLNEVFAFFSDPKNLSRITPTWLNFEIRSEHPIEMATGSLIDYRIRFHGIPLKWRSEITAWDPPFRFVDEQRIGPYKYWIHEHSFREMDGKTAVTDWVRYAVPGGVLIHRLFVARDLEKIFSYRRKVLGEILSEVHPRRGEEDK